MCVTDSHQSKVDVESTFYCGAALCFVFRMRHRGRVSIAVQNCQWPQCEAKCVMVFLPESRLTELRPFAPQLHDRWSQLGALRPAV